MLFAPSRPILRPGANCGRIAEASRLAWLVDGKAYYDAVAAAMERLPERQKMVLALCFFEGMSNIEAGKIMSLSVGAVESLLVRARRTLRRELAQTYDELREG